jgi:hypothetical protein
MSEYQIKTQQAIQQTTLYPVLLEKYRVDFVGENKNNKMETRM